MREVPLTVIIPAFQAAHTVLDSVRSTLKALSARDRVIVRDDGSTDGTGDRLRSVADPRLRVLSGENVGVGRGSQLLLAEVETPYVARLDADDLSLRWRFRIARRSLSAGRAQVLFSSTLGMTERCPVVPRSLPFRLGPRGFALFLLIANPVAHSTMVAQTDCLRRIGGYRECLAEDYDLWLRLAADGIPMIRLGIPLVRYRYSSSQLTASSTWAHDLQRNVLLAESYGVLCRGQLGVEPTWLSALINRWHGDRSESLGLKRFSHLVRVKGRQLPLGARIVIETKLRRLGL